MMCIYTYRSRSIYLCDLSIYLSSIWLSIYLSVSNISILQYMIRFKDRSMNIFFFKCDSATTVQPITDQHFECQCLVGRNSRTAECAAVNDHPQCTRLVKI